MKMPNRVSFCTLLITCCCVALRAQDLSTPADAAQARDRGLRRQLNWYIGAPVLSALYKDNSALANKNFNRPNTFVAVTQPNQLELIPAGWNVTPVFTFFDEKKLNAAINGCPEGSPPECHPLPAAIKGVVLDDEFAVCLVFGSNNCTPKAEESDPLPYEQDAAKITAQHGLIYIDVGADPDPRQGGFRFHAAAFADYVDSQIQLAEHDQQKYAHLAATYEAGWNSALAKYAGYPQAKTKSAKVIVGIGARVRNCPEGTKGCKSYVTADVNDIVAAVRNTQSLTGLWGYWLNCPSGKPAPEGPGPCGPADIKAMEQFLDVINP
jgi:hypothetical protein